MQQSVKALIISMRAGAGHVKAAEALESVFPVSEKMELKRIDLMDYSSALVDFLYNKSYLNIVRALPELYAYNYRNYRRAQHFIKPRFLMDKINLSDFMDFVKAQKPDIVFCTHFIPAAIVAHYREKWNRALKLVVSITDYEFHPLWFVGGVDLYTVATEEMKAELEFAGVDPKKIKITGIPVHKNFDSLALSRKVLQHKYNLKSESPTVLFTGGSAGITPVDKIIENLLEFSLNFQAIIVCGKNKNLLEKISKASEKDARISCIFGHVDFIHELMAVSNLMVTKPGGLTVSEALAMNLPMLLIEPIPGQEEANAGYLLESGAAWRANTLPSAVHKIKKLISNPELLRTMSVNSARISKPLASIDIINAGLGLL